MEIAKDDSALTEIADGSYLKILFVRCAFYHIKLSFIIPQVTENNKVKIW